MLLGEICSNNVEMTNDIMTKSQFNQVKVYHACTDKADEFTAMRNVVKWIIQKNLYGYMIDTAGLHKGKQANGKSIETTNPTWQTDTFCFITNGTSFSFQQDERWTTMEQEVIQAEPQGMSWWKSWDNFIVVQGLH